MNKYQTGSNFSKIIEKKGIKKAEVSRATGIPYSCLTDWTHGRYMPKLDKIHKIADYLNVSPAILLDDSLDIETETNSINDMYVQLSDDKKSIVLDIIKVLYDVETKEKEMNLLLNKYNGILELAKSINDINNQ